MSVVVAIANQKGGVGKTTTASAMIAGLSKKGYSVLGVDLDPQGNLTENFGVDSKGIDTAYELLSRKADLDDVILTLAPNTSLIASNIMLAGIEHQLQGAGRDYRLKEALQPAVKNNVRYDYVIIDTPPSLSTLTVNAFTLADKVIIPTLAGIFSVLAIEQLYESCLKPIRQYNNSDLSIAGVLMTKHNPRTIIGRQLKEGAEIVAEKIGTKLYKTYIRNSVAVDESQANKKDIFVYDKSSTVALDYSDFVDEFLKRGGASE